MNMFTNVLLLSCLALVRVLSALPMPEISSSVERFYNENLERHVKHIAEQIVAHNVHVQQQKHPHAHQHHHHGHVRAKHERHPHGSTAAAAASQASEEEMQSDQPMPGSQGHTTGNAHQLRLAQGQQKIEDRDRIAMENMIKHRLIMFVNGSNSYGERDRSFYANCDQPKGTDENDDLMKLHFTLSQLEDNIAAANLRLHRKHIAKQTSANIDSNGDALPCNQDAEKLYRVTVYHHAKGARKHKLERKIVESCVISESMAFVNLNVLHGVRELNKGKFFGVAIQIEDQFGGIVKASDFFNGPTCTVGMPTAQALPTRFEEDYAASFGRITHPANVIRKPVQPKLDIKTIQEPNEGGAGHVYDTSAPARTDCRGRQVQLRHAHHHRPQTSPPVGLEGTIIVSNAGDFNPNLDLNELKLKMDRIQEDKARREGSTMAT